MQYDFSKITNRFNSNSLKWDVKFDDLEKKLSKSSTTLMILCNPHNPIGKVWSREILRKIGELCLKHNVLVLSDEIHCDLIYEDNIYTPFASISSEIAQNSITCIALTKTFNLAGLQTSSIVIPNEDIRRKVNRGINTDEVAEPNAFAIEATIAAFRKGEPWLKELIQYLSSNRELVKQFIAKELPQLNLIDSQATYLLWIDCKDITSDSEELCRYIREVTGLYLSSGTVYGANGNGFIRMNIACLKERLEDGIVRLKKGIKNYINEIEVKGEI